MKEIKGYQCEFCDKKYWHKGTVKKHEKTCWHNPTTKACQTCCFVENIEDIRTPELRLCINEIDIMERLKSNCPYWMPVNDQLDLSEIIIDKSH